MSIVLKSMSGYLGPLLLCLQIEPASEGIEIISGILQCCQSISALNAHVWRNPVYLSAISNNCRQQILKSGLCGKIPSAIE